MKKYILSLALVLTFGHLYSQGTFITAGSGGNWNASGTWTLIDGSDVDGIPDADDDVYVLFDGVNVNVNVTVNHLHVQGDVAGVLIKTGFGTTRTITINGSLSGDDGGGTPVAPTVNVFASTAFAIVFTGAGTIISEWSTASPFENLTINNGGGSFTIGSPIALGGGTFAQSSGSGTISSDFTNNTGTFIMSGGSITFNGNVTNGGTFNVTGGSAITFNGDITNNSSFTVAVPTTFSKGSPQTVGGSQAVTFNSSATFNNAMDFNTSFTFGGAVSAGTNSVSFAKDFTNNGLYSGSGLITFDGTVAQSIAGTTNTNFQNVTISNTTAQVAVNGTGSSIKGTLTLAAGSDFNTNGKLTIVSNNQGTGRIAAIPGTATFTGNIIYQRYIGSNNPAIATGQWHSVGSPVGGSTSDISGSGFPVPGTDFARYTESTAGVADNGWETASGVPFTAITDTRGYSMWVRTADVGKTLQFTGPINSTTANMSVTFTNTGAGTDDGWNLVTNPYASDVTWGSGWNTNSIQTEAAVWNGAGYTYFSSGTIASGQSFYVRATAGDASLQATQAAKTTGGTFFRTEEVFENELHISLADGLNTDLARIKFRSDANEEYDAQYDASKLSNQIFNLSSVTVAGTSMAVNALPLSDCNRITKLNITNIKAGNYKLDFEHINSFNGLEITLKDNFLTTSTVLTEGSEYSFEVTADAASWGDTRFEIEFAPATINTSLNYATNNSCEETQVNVTIENSQSGLEYSLMAGSTILATTTGTGGAVEFMVDKSSLIEGTNTFDVSIANTNTSCASSDLISSAVSIDYTAPAAVTAVTNGEQCGKAEVTLGASGAPANGYYKWYESIDAIEAISGENAATFTTTLLDATKTYFVSVVNSNGCEGERAPVNAVINELPTTPQVTGAEACSGDIASVVATGATDGNYRWYSSADINASPLEGEMNSSYSTEISGDYYVSIVNEFGCESDRIMVTAVINELPTAPQVTDGAACKGNAASLIAEGATDGNYRWYNSSMVALEGVVNGTFETENSSDYYVSIINESGCESELVLVKAIINELPIAEITQEGNILTSSALQGNQWYKDGVLVEGAISSTYEVVASGSYTVSVNNGTCSNLSIARELEITSIDQGQLKYDQVLIYPNPIGNEDLNINFGDQMGQFTKAVVMNAQGKTLENITITNSVDKLSINFTQYKNGIYYISLIGANDKFVYKVLKH